LERNPNTSEPEIANQIVTSTVENSVCEVCGKEFEQPLLAEKTSGSHTETYYACPRCLTKVGEVAQEEEAEVDEGEEVEEIVEAEPENLTSDTQSAPDCPYYLGYLKKRQRDSPIPETCFTCSKMIECIH
jgi:DNA-directed RNA polymerase subunit RPC12/RpoP